MLSMRQFGSPGAVFVAVALLVGSVPVATLGEPGGGEGVGGESKTESKGEESESDGERASVPRGSIFAESGVGLAGFVVGGGATGTVTALGLRLLTGPPQGRGVYALGAVGLAVGWISGTVFAGVGAGLGGNWTGGNGEVTKAIEGSLLGGAGGILVPLAVDGFIARVNDRPISGVAPLVGLFAVPVTSTIGGVLGYRLSAKRPDEETPSATVRPYLTPPLGDRHLGQVGVRVDF